MIGEKLKNRREQLGLSLKEVETELKIRSKYLQALEEERYDLLPGKAYVKPFLKSYARFLGLDLTFEELPEFEEKSFTTSTEISSKTSKIVFEKKSNFSTYLLVVLVIFIALLGVYFLTNLKNSSAKPQNIIKKPPVTPKIIEKQTKKKTSFVKEKTIVIEAVYGACWLEAKEDNKIIFSGKILPPTKKQFTSSRALTIKFGNAGAVIVTVNGITYGTPGQKGQVLKITY